MLFSPEKVSRPRLALLLCARVALWLRVLSVLVVLVGCETTDNPGLDATVAINNVQADTGSATPDAAAPAMPASNANDASVAKPEASVAVSEAGVPDASAFDAGAIDASSVTGDAGPSANDAGEAGSSDAATMPGTVAIPAPAAEGCVTNVSAGDHTFTCDGVKFQVMVDERCTKFACGLIFDVHGAVMTGDDMRNNVRLHKLAPSKGYLTVHPTAPDSTWNWTTHPETLVAFMTSMIKAFHVDTRRVHVTGFSMGSGMTFWFLCNHRDALASVAPVTGSSASQVMTPDGKPCIESIAGEWKPRVPILFMSGRQDTALSIDAARMRADGLVSRLGLTGGMQIAGDMTFSRKHWEGADGMVFEFLEHNYANGLLQGHCIPGGVAGDLFACDGSSSFNWGELVLQWFIDHPKR